MPDLRVLLHTRIVGAIEQAPIIKQGETVSEYFSQHDSRQKIKERIEKRAEDKDEEMSFDKDDQETVKSLKSEGIS